MIKWDIKSTTEVIHRKIFSIKDYMCTHSGLEKDHTFTIIESPDWINVAARTEDGDLILIKQHRLGTDEITLEIPAGLIEKDEDPLNAAIRELEEETGYRPGNILLMKKLYANPAIMNNSIYFFFADNCRKVNKQNLDPSEDIEIELFPVDNIDNLLSSEKISHQIIHHALMLFKDKINES